MPPTQPPFDGHLAAMSLGRRPPLGDDDGPEILVQGVDDPAGRRAELLAGLAADQAIIPPKFFYDAQGCAIYEAICHLAEYYPTRTETAIFAAHEAEIAGCLPRDAQFVDLGCGDGAKALRWIEATQVARYIGVDIAEDWLRTTLLRGAKRFPGVAFDGVVTDFTRGLDLRPVLQPERPTVFFYPGSSIGNFEPAAALQLLRDMRRNLRPGDRLLIGADAPKDRDVLRAAYDDALGVTAAFNRNVLRVVNREIGAGFDPADFDHRAVFDERHSRIEMHLVARRDLRVPLGDGHAGLQARAFAAGEHIVTEYSYKHAPARFAQLLHEAGFADVQHFTDERGWYGVYVASPADYRQ